MSRSWNWGDQLEACCKRQLTKKDIGLTLGCTKEDKHLQYYSKVLLIDYIVRLDVKYEGKNGLKKRNAGLCTGFWP